MTSKKENKAKLIQEVLTLLLSHSHSHSLTHILPLPLSNWLSISPRVHSPLLTTHTHTHIHTHTHTHSLTRDRNLYGPLTPLSKLESLQSAYRMICFTVDQVRRVCVYVCVCVCVCMYVYVCVCKFVSLSLLSCFCDCVIEWRSDLCPHFLPSL